MRPGDCILLTQGIAVEGTCILAREYARQLISMGMSVEETDRCRNFLADPGIGIDAVGGDGEPMPWLHFEVDEIARIVESFNKKSMG